MKRSRLARGKALMRRTPLAPRYKVERVCPTCRRPFVIAHPRHGRRVGEHKTKPVVRAEVAARDGDWCLFCGKPPAGLHLHRVRYGSEGGQYRPDNCVQLCALHHDLVHSDKRLWKPVLLVHLAEAAASPGCRNAVKMALVTYGPTGEPLQPAKLGTPDERTD